MDCVAPIYSVNTHAHTCEHTYWTDKHPLQRTHAHICAHQIGFIGFWLLKVIITSTHDSCIGREQTTRTARNVNMRSLLTFKVSILIENACDFCCSLWHYIVCIRFIFHRIICLQTEQTPCDELFYWERQNKNNMH